MPIANWLLIFLVGAGVLGTQLIGAGVADIGISEIILREDEGLLTPPKSLSSGELRFAYSNALSEEEDISGSVSFNGGGLELPEGRVIRLDNFVSADYRGDILGRRSDCVDIQRGLKSGERDTCLEERTVVTQMRKAYQLYHRENMLDIKFADEINVIPFKKVYKQKVTVINNYDRALDIQVGYLNADAGIAIDPLTNPPKEVNFLVKPGANEIEIEVPTENIISEQLDLAVRLIYTYDGVRAGVNPIQFNSVSRVYDIRPNLDNGIVEVPKPVKRTNFFSGTGFGLTQPVTQQPVVQVTQTTQKANLVTTGLFAVLLTAGIIWLVKRK